MSTDKPDSCVRLVKTVAGPSPEDEFAVTFIWYNVHASRFSRRIVVTLFCVVFICTVGMIVLLQLFVSLLSSTMDI